MGELVEEYFSRLFSTSSSIGFNEIHLYQGAGLEKASRVEEKLLS